MCLVGTRVPKAGIGAERIMRRAWRIVGWSLLAVLALALSGTGLLAYVVFSRPPLRPAPSTTAGSMSRKACLDCHAPIADEWRDSYHFKSLTGPCWQDVRRLGYLAIFDRFRKPCVNCHAPANVLDLSDATPPSGYGGGRLGVECTPNLLRNPEGTIPAAREDDVDLGVDCTACHVSRHGITGPGRSHTTAHETIADPRFESPSLTAETLCRTCHRATVESWKRTALAAGGTTCLDCHMPEVRGPAVVGGPDRQRRSHRFPADKDPAMLRRAVKARLEITDRTAHLRITNDGAGHDLPSGGNWLIIKMEARDPSGRSLGRKVETFGREEALLFDFWPFSSDTRIPFGESREVLMKLPGGRGTVEAVVRYHDWMKMTSDVLTLKEAY